MDNFRQAPRPDQSTSEAESSRRETLAGASSASPPAPKPKLPACDRCKQRKIKCDAGLPQCSPCGKAGAECVGRDQLPSVPRGLVYELQQRVQKLEAELTETRSRAGSQFPDMSGNINRSSTSSSADALERRVGSADFPRRRRREFSSSPPGDEIPPTPKRGRYSTANRTNNEGFSTLSPTNIIAADALPYDRDLSVELRGLAELRKDAVAHLSELNPSQRTHLPSYDPALVGRLARRYISFLNDALPVFEDAVIIDLVERMRSNSSRERNGASLHSFEKCQVHLVIGLAFATLARVQHRSSELARAGQAHWRAAQVYVPAAMKGTDLPKLQIILLQLQFVLLFPEHGNAWELSGQSLRLAAALSLNREGISDSLASSTMGRRLFWTAYCLDVSLAVALARPTAISDAWISTRPPTMPTTGRESPSPLKPHFSFVNHVGLRRLQSEIYHYLYAFDDVSNPERSDQPAIGEWLRSRLNKLENWRKQYNVATPFVTAQWTELNFHITKTLMFRPSPRIPVPGVSALLEALDSSAQTIRLYKLNWRTFRVNFPWLATHHVFMAGLSFLNSLKSLHMLSIPTGVSLVDITMHVQSCASLLEVLSIVQDDGTGEQGNSNKVRDAFDAAAYAVLNSLFAAGAAARPETSNNAARAAGPVAGNAESPFNVNDVTSSLSLLASSAALAEAPAGRASETLTSFSPLPAVVADRSAATPSRASLPLPATASGSATNAFAPANTAANPENDFSFLDWFLHPIDGGDVPWQDSTFGPDGLGDLAGTVGDGRGDLWI